MSTFLVSDSKILVLGGFSTEMGNNYNVWTVDLSNGFVNQVGKITEDIWSTYAPIYCNGRLYIISTGEEVDDEMPKIFEYPVMLPMN